METFTGHILVGTPIIIIGLWLIYQLFQQYYLVKRVSSLRQSNRQSVSFRSEIFFRKNCCRKYPFEELIGMVAVSIAIIGEVGYWIFVSPGYSTLHMHHLGIYSAYFAAAGFCALKYYRYILIEGLEYLGFIMAIATNGFLLNAHNDGRRVVNAQLHSYLVHLSILVIISLVLELHFRNNFLISLCRCLFFTVQGTWLWQTALIAFDPLNEGWDLDSHELMMLVPIIYFWHFVGIIVLMTVISNVAYYKVMHLSSLSLRDKFQCCLTKDKYQDTVHLNSEKYSLIASHDEEA